MKTVTEKIKVDLGPDGDMEDLTDTISQKLEETGLEEGQVLVFMVGSTGAISTVEFEPGLQKDIPRALERVAPSNIDYEHHKTWNDGNGRSHVRATLIGPSETIPFQGGELMNGTWQQVVAINLDTRDREREIVLQFTGE